MLIYVAGPIRNGGITDHSIIEKNVQNAMRVQRMLFAKNWSVICPQLNYFAWKYWLDVNMGDIGWESWMKNDLEIIQKCDAIFYMKPEIYGESKGAMMELEFAKKNGMSIWSDLDDVPFLEKKDD